MRTIRKIHNAESRPIADLKTVSPLPSQSLEMLDPFLFLNHHGPQVYKSENNGLPFGPHPHRGIETVTFILDGDISHKDSGGHENIISSGGIQWMTAGKGLIHSETSSEDFKKNGGRLEILQLWLNLPSALKMIESKYLGLQSEEIPTLLFNDEKIKVKLIAGSLGTKKAAFETVTPIQINLINFSSSGEFFLRIPKSNTLLFYVIKGKLNVNGAIVNTTQLAEFNDDGEELYIYAETDSVLLFGHAKPFNEPVVAHGPFVMNTEKEIREAYEDFRTGKFGMM